MELLQGSFFLSGILLFFGGYQILKEVFRLSRNEDNKRVRRAFAAEKESEWLMQTAFRLGAVLPFSEGKKKRLKIKLKAAGIEIAPETYLARAIVKSIIPFSFFVLFLLLPGHFFTAIFAGFSLVLSGMLYFRDFEELEEVARKRKEEIEWELPRFVNSVVQELKYHRDIIRILESYKESAGKTFKEELEITIADMKTGNMENALIRFDGRMGIASLSGVIRGFLSVIQGEDNIAYFQMLQHDLKALEYQKLKRIAIKRPEKVGKYTFLIVISFLLIYMVVFGVSILKGFQEFSRY